MNLEAQKLCDNGHERSNDGALSVIGVLNGLHHFDEFAKMVDLLRFQGFVRQNVEENAGLEQVADLIGEMETLQNQGSLDSDDILGLAIGGKA